MGFADSLSSLQSFLNIILEILTIYNRLHQTGIDVKFAWIPSHVGIIGNEITDKTAKMQYLATLR